MAPFSLLTAGAALLAKSLSGSWSSSLLRCTSALPAVQCLSTWTSGPPKRPLNGYMRFVQQQQPVMVRQNPDVKSVDIIRKIAQQWRILSPEQKKPFQEAALKARDQFKVDLQRYQAQLSPVQNALQAQERKDRLAKRRAIRKKRELNSLGKPKRPRSAFNIYMSEHFEEARGVTMQAKMKSLFDDWKNLLSHQKKVYMQLAEDDKIRYSNEMRSWEDHMVEIGRDDLLREQTLSARKRAAAKKAAKKATPKPSKATPKPSKAPPKPSKAKMAVSSVIKPRKTAPGAKA